TFVSVRRPIARGMPVLNGLNSDASKHQGRIADLSRTPPSLNPASSWKAQNVSHPGICGGKGAVPSQYATPFLRPRTEPSTKQKWTMAGCMLSKGLVLLLLFACRPLAVIHMPRPIHEWAYKRTPSCTPPSVSPNISVLLVPSGTRSRAFWDRLVNSPS